MNTLEVTDEQYAFIQQLRERISADVVGKYGYVRERDAIQFLIDNLDGDLEVDAAFEIDSAAGRDVAASVDAALAETESSQGEGEGEGDAITFDESEDALSGEEGAGDGEEAEAEEDEDGSDDLEDDADESTDGEADETDDANAEAEDGDEDAESETGGAASDDDMLDQMMNLLDTHDDKWDESPSGDYRYRVELPDGGTEDVQTKDDVRAILFKNYR